MVNSCKRGAAAQRTTSIRAKGYYLTFAVFLTLPGGEEVETLLVGWDPELRELNVRLSLDETPVESKCRRLWSHIVLWWPDI